MVTKSLTGATAVSNRRATTLTHALFNAGDNGVFVFFLGEKAWESKIL